VSSMVEILLHTAVQSSGSRPPGIAESKLYNVPIRTSIRSSPPHLLSSLADLLGRWKDARNSRLEPSAGGRCGAALSSTWGMGYLSHDVTGCTVRVEGRS
jgi:hypothetical protein